MPASEGSPAMLTQERDQGGEDRDVTRPACSLGRSKRPVAKKLTPHVDHAGIEIEVGPLESECFPLPHPGEQRSRHEWAVQRRAVVEQTRDLVTRQEPWLSCIQPGTFALHQPGHGICPRATSTDGSVEHRAQRRQRSVDCPSGIALLSHPGDQRGNVISRDG